MDNDTKKDTNKGTDKDKKTDTGLRKKCLKDKVMCHLGGASHRRRAVAIAICVCLLLVLVPVGVVNAVTKGKRMGTRLESRKTGITLTSGVYYVDSDVTITAKTGPAIDIADGAEVFIYVDAGKTLTCVGGDGKVVESKVNGDWTWDKTRAGAGIHLPAGASLTLMGEGTVNAQGGDGYACTDGHDAEAGSYHWEKTASKSWVKSGRGGAGGCGAGSAGAGIGGNGANGGDGAVSYAVTLTGSTKDSIAEGKRGEGGKDGEIGENMGNLSVWDTMTVNASAGENKKREKVADGGEPSSSKATKYREYSGSSNDFRLVAAGCGGGTQGRDAGNSCDIGGSGYGGWGGASGARGAVANMRKGGTWKTVGNWFDGKVATSTYDNDAEKGELYGSGHSAYLYDYKGTQHGYSGTYKSNYAEGGKWKAIYKYKSTTNYNRGDRNYLYLCKVTVNLLLDGKSDTDWATEQTVTLRMKSGDSYEQVCEMFNTGMSDGNYTSAYYYELHEYTGDLYIFVNGVNTGQTASVTGNMVFLSSCDRSATVNAYTTTVTATANMAPLRNAKVQFYDQGALAYTFTEKKKGVYEAAVIYRPDNGFNNSYEIYIDGSSVQKWHDLSPTNVKATVNLYDIKVYVTEDGVNKKGIGVTLWRDGKLCYTLAAQTDGGYAYRLVAESGAAEATGTYDIYVDGEDSGKDIDFSSAAKLTAEIRYITLSVTLRKDGAGWSGVGVAVTDSAGKEYDLTDGGGGAYKKLLPEDTYSVAVPGTSSSARGTDILSASSRSITMDYYTVVYHRNYEALATVPDEYQTYIMRSDDKLIIPATPSAGGASFRYWAGSKNGTESYDFTQKVTSTVNLYAIWEEPSIVIGDAVRCTAGGAVSGSGTYYMMKNLSISGISSDFRINAVQLDYTNTSGITIPGSFSGYTKNVTVGKNTEGTATERMVLTFNSPITASEAQELLRSIIVQPKSNVAHTMQVTAYTEAEE